MTTEVFLSPKIELEPGSVANKNYFNIDFPRGHIAVKRFHVEIVDGHGNSIPLHETYLHHWVVVLYFQSKGPASWNQTVRGPPIGATPGSATDIGGLRCCHDGMRCSVKQGYSGVKRGFYMKYTVQYIDWDDFIVSIKIYILDVTDPWTKADESKGLIARHHCLIEYDVDSCPIEAANDDGTHKKSLTVSLPTGGDVIYGVGHQHTGGIGTTLYGEGGKEICSSGPTYGNRDEPGNEAAGYIVGMSTCYPSPGSVKISAGETLTVVSKYNSSQGHTGVMGLFYLLIANPVKAPSHIRYSTGAHKEITGSNLGWDIALFGTALIAVVMFVFQSTTGREGGYEAIAA